MFELVAQRVAGTVAILKDNLRGSIQAVERRFLPGRQENGFPCVPNVCQLSRTPLDLRGLQENNRVGILFIHQTVNVYRMPRPTSAKDAKTGFVISRSPVRSRRVAPSIWSGINQL